MTNESGTERVRERYESPYGGTTSSEPAARPDEDTAEQPPRRRWRLPSGWRRYLVPVLAGGIVVTLALAATLLILLVQASETSRDEVGQFLDQQRGQAEDRARNVIALLMNYDATNLEEVSEQILEISTGNFKDQYEELIGRDLGAALQEASASSRGQILSGPDISFKSPSEAVAIARVEQTTQSNENPGGRTFVYTLQIILVDTRDGGWKADDITILSSVGG